MAVSVSVHQTALKVIPVALFATVIVVIVAVWTHPLELESFLKPYLYGYCYSYHSWCEMPLRQTFMNHGKPSVPLTRPFDIIICNVINLNLCIVSASGSIKTSTNK